MRSAKSKLATTKPECADQRRRSSAVISNPPPAIFFSDENKLQFFRTCLTRERVSFSLLFDVMGQIWAFSLNFSFVAHLYLFKHIYLLMNDFRVSYQFCDQLEVKFQIFNSEGNLSFCEQSYWLRRIGEDEDDEGREGDEPYRCLPQKATEERTETCKGF